MPEKKIPIVEAVFVDPKNPSQVQLTCPFCGRTHYHGFDEAMLSKKGSHRIEHCIDQSVHGGYMVKVEKQGKGEQDDDTE